MNLPAAVTNSFIGEPVSGELDSAALLITANPQGLPMVCLLSRRQVHVNGENVSTLIRSRRTLKNLETAQQAILHVVADNAAWTIQLELTAIEDPRSDGAVPVQLKATNVEEDRVAEALEPLRYLATDALITREGPSISPK